MRVWLIEIGEPLPVDGNVRLLRTGVLAETLSALGVDTLWWSAAFSHETKRHRDVGQTTLPLDRHLTLKLLDSCGYARNVSWARLRDHAQVARAFAALAPRETPPDVIVSGLPTPGLCCAAADYAGWRGVPLLLDLRDQWPEVFLDLLPKGLRWAGRLGLRGMFRQTVCACRRATGLIAVTEPFLRWGLDCAGRTRGLADRVFPIGYKRRRYPAEVLDEARRFWDQAGVRAGEGWLTACFFGTLGRQFALETVIEAARLLHHEERKIRVVLCGSGDFAEAFRRKARGLTNVVFPSRIDAPQIQVLMERSQIGLAPYRNTPTFVGALPNKAAEYLSAGLPLVSTLTGGLDELLKTYGCGRTYAETDAGELAKILRQLAADPQTCWQMSASARRLFADRFDADQIYAAYAQHIAQVAQDNAHARRAA